LDEMVLPFREVRFHVVSMFSVFSFKYLAFSMLYTIPCGIVYPGMSFRHYNHDIHSALHVYAASILWPVLPHASDGPLLLFIH